MKDFLFKKKTCFLLRVFYATLFGGITLIDKSQYNISNGYSNQYFGWGGEGELDFNIYAK